MHDVRTLWQPLISTLHTPWLLAVDCTDTSTITVLHVLTLLLHASRLQKQAAQKAAVNALRKLSSAFKASKNVKLLQHPPAAVLSKHAAELLQQSSNHISAFKAALQQFPKEPTVLDGLLEEIMPYKPVAMLGRLAAWLQSSPELLQLTELATDMESLPAASPGRLWLECIHVTSLIGIVAWAAEELHGGYDLDVELQLGDAGKQQVRCLQDSMQDIVSCREVEYRLQLSRHCSNEALLASAAATAHTVTVLQ